MNKLIRLLTLSAIMTALPVVTLPAFAEVGQVRGGGPGMVRDGERRVRDNALERLNKIDRRLKLTDEQKGKILPLLQEEQNQIRSIWGDGNLSRNQQRAKSQELRQTTNDKIRELLNPEQQKISDDMRSKAKAWRDERLRSNTGKPPLPGSMPPGN